MLQSGSPTNLTPSQFSEIFDQLYDAGSALGTLAIKLESHGGSDINAVANVQRDVSLIDANLQAIQSDLEQPPSNTSHDVAQLTANIQRYNVDVTVAHSQLVSS